MVENIAQTLVQVVAEHGDRIGVIEARSGRSLTFNELFRRVNGYALYFKERGVGPGQRVMLMVTPSADFICLTFALFQLGVTIILIDPGMGYKNLLRCIEGVAPTCFIGVPKARLFATLFPKPFGSVQQAFCCGRSFGLFGPDIRQRINLKALQQPVYQPDDIDLAAIIFTTGSTGPPKGVRYEHTIFAAQRKRVRDYYGIGAGDVDQPAFPLFALISASLGACAVIPDMDPTRPARVDPGKFTASLIEYGVTYSFGSPAIWNVVSRYCLASDISLPKVKKVLMAGAPVPGELLERMRRVLPEDASIFTPYGATESLPIVSMESREILAETWPLTKKGRGTCVGRPLPGIEIRIMAITDGPVSTLDQACLLPAGEIGEILVRGDVVTRAYENNPRENELAKITEDYGRSFWHRMGDVGYVDQQGRLWFCGRKAHRVITENGPMFTICCEAIINEHPEVFRSALVGIADGRANISRPVIIVEPVAGFRGSEQRLLEEIAAMAAANPLTAGITHFLVHRDFPVDIRHNSKIFREKLAVWAADRLVGKR